MKIKDGFIIKQVAGSTVAAATGDAAERFNGIITLNETGEWLFKKLMDGTSEENLIKDFLSEYDVTEDVAKADIDEFINKLKKEDILEY